MAMGDQARAEPDTKTSPTLKQEGGAGVAEEDRGGEGSTNHIRIAIGQLSGVPMWELDHHPDEYLSVAKLSSQTSSATWCRG